MKLSDHHAAHGLSGTLRALGTNTELHFEFLAHETRLSVELNVGGHAYPCYLELCARGTHDVHDEADLGLRFVLGPRPAVDYQPSPARVAGSTAKPDVPVDARFRVEPVEGLVPVPPLRAAKASVPDVPGFPVAEGPETKALDPSTAVQVTVFSDMIAEGERREPQAPQGLPTLLTAPVIVDKPGFAGGKAKAKKGR